MFLFRLTSFRCYENVVRLQIIDEIEMMSTNVLQTMPITEESLDSIDSMFRSEVYEYMWMIT